jgi:hypothetical protein
MDSGTFNESFTISANVTMEPLYGKIPEISTTTVVTEYFELTSSAINIYGYTFKESTSITYGIHFNATGTNYTGTIKNNSFGGGGALSIPLYINCSAFTGNLNTNRVTGGALSGIRVRIAANSAGTIEKNIVYNASEGIVTIGIARDYAGTINNNLCYNNTSSGIVVGQTDFTGTLENNTSYNNGLYGLGVITAATGTLRNNIFWNNSTDVYSSSGPITITYTNYSTKNGNVTAGAGSITTDPDFCKTTLPFKLGIKSTSGAYHTDSAVNNMGITTHMFNVQANDFSLNGIILDCLDSYCHSIIISTNSNYTDPTIKWCTIKDSIGILIDFYDNDTNIDAIIQNTKIFNGGQGCAVAYGNNTIEQCIFKNYSIDLWGDQSTYVIDHCIFYESIYGLFFASNGGNLSLKNSIFHQNSLYGIYSDVSISITYCCITSAVNANVDITDSSNIVEDPLFVDPSNDDFNIKTIEGGYDLDSFCKEASDDSPAKDIGVYDILYDIDEESWETYTVAFNPSNMDEEDLAKGRIRFDDAEGQVSLWEKSHRIVFPFIWDGTQAVSKELRLKIRHFNRRIPSRANGLTKDECKFRVFVLPTTMYGEGSGTIDASAKTLTDSSATYIEDEKTGWWTTVAFKEGTNAAIVTVTGGVKELQKVGAFAGENWENYYLWHENMYYLVKSNTDDALILSDPNGLLSDVSGIVYRVVKPFRITSHTATVLTLQDIDSELVNGTYSYWINFVLMKSRANTFKSKQPRFDYSKDEWKNNFGVTFEEIDV